MADILLMILPEEGHLLASCKLAKELQARQHRVRYVVPRRLADFIRAKGTECLVLPEELWQTRKTLRQTTLGGSHIEGIGAANANIWENRDEFARILNDLQPGLLIVDSYLPSVAFMAQGNGVPAIFLNSTLDIMISSILLRDVLPPEEFQSSAVAACLSIPQLITCPREFEFNHNPTNRALFYIEASIDLRCDEPTFKWEQVNESLPIIFCNLGSQAHLYQESKEIFQTIIEAIAARPDWQMILSVGRHFSAEFPAVPTNVLVVNWVPQLEILKRASIMITHGGLGTVKECILFGVPMIVFPMSRNQPMSGARVVYHGLGVRGDMRHVTVESVHALMEKIEHNPSYKQRVREMGEKFRKAEEAGRGVKIIEKILSILERKNAQRLSAAVR